MKNDNQPATQTVRNTSVQIASTPEEQLFFLKQFGVVYFWLHIFAALLLCSLSWVRVATGSTGIFIWFSAIVLLATCYWLVNSKFTQDALMEKQLRHYRLINISLCLAWGLSGILLFSHDPIAQTIHLCILLVIALSTWPISIISAKDFYIQLALLLTPITLMLALQQNLQTNLLCFVILAFVATIVLMTRVFTRILNTLFSKEQSLIKKISIDPVTQLISSRHFDQMLKREWRRSARDQQPLSLIMVEIDDFREMESQLDTKQVKKYLKTVAECLQSTAQRGSDALAHYDYVNANFVALLPGTDQAAATNMAKRFQLAIEKAALPNPMAEDKIVRASVGVSSCEPVMPANNKRRHAKLGETGYPANLLQNAERALMQNSN